MRKSLFYLLTGTIIVLASCNKEEEPKVDPLVGLWELDDASREVSGYSYYDFDRNNLYGESLYTIEFKDDNTYEREMEDIPQSSGTFDHSEEGEWEKDGEDLDLDSEDDEVNGFGYAFTIVEINDSDLVLEYNATIGVFPDNKIDEWFDDGTIDSNGFFAVTQEEYDSLVTNFGEQADAVITLEFDKQ